MNKVSKYYDSMVRYNFPNDFLRTICFIKYSIQILTIHSIIVAAIASSKIVFYAFCMKFSEKNYKIFEIYEIYSKILIILIINNNSINNTTAIIIISNKKDSRCIANQISNFHLSYCNFFFSFHAKEIIYKNYYLK